MVNKRTVRLDAAFNALADPTRRAIIERLARDEASVTELARPFDMSLPAVSRHLRVLEQAGLISRERLGRVHRMKLALGPLREAVAWMDQQHRFWEGRLDRLASYLEKSNPKETESWQRPTPRKSPSASSARSPRRPRKSSTPGSSRNP